MSTLRQLRRIAGIRGMLLLLVALPVATFLSAVPAAAHTPGASALVLDARPDRVAGALHMPADQLEQATGLDVTGPKDAAVSSVELVDYVADRMRATSPAGAWHIEFGAAEPSELGGQPYVTLPLTLRPREPGGEATPTLTCTGILREVVSHDIHVYLGRARDGALETSGLHLAGTFNYANSTLTLPAHRDRTFTATVGVGTAHVLEGLDHLLFLAMLLLPAPLLAGTARRWGARRGARSTLLRTVHVVTAFTLGHSLTLAYAMLGGPAPQGAGVETVIALSVAVSALHALRPLVRRGEVLLAGGFGLVHGLAFAGLLRELAGGTGAALRDLLAFNIGVELAQLLVVAAVLPSLLVLASGPRYRLVRNVLGVAGLAAALAWTAERALGLTTPLAPALSRAEAAPETLAVALAVGAAADLLIRRRGSHRTSGTAPACPGGTSFHAS
ncbi:HupE/UreJ family protein [Streptomyces sp. NPDC014986]|uniref:HupE/UreJ family protein n=1 Tax=Streptomyces sp. NPDC014986 TaxID=3364934 RepID=UPI0036F63303